MLYGLALKKIRKEKKITIVKLAKHLNRTREAVSSWERGIYQPGDSDVRIIAQFLNVSVQDISDLPELEVAKTHIEKPDSSELDTTGLSSDIALKLKALQDECMDLKATNTKLRTYIFKYRVLIQTLPILIYVKDKNLKYTYANDQFLNLISKRHNKDSIAGASSSEIFDFKDYFPILELEQKILQTKQRIIHQKVYIPGTSQKRIGILTITPILNEDKTLERIVGALEDMSEHFALDEKRKKLDDAVNKIHHMIWIGETEADKEDSFRYTFISNAISEVYGVHKHEAFKDNKLWLKLVHKDYVQTVEDWVKSKEFPKKLKYKINNPKKGIRWILSEVIREKETIFYGIVTDITDEENLRKT